MNKLVIYLLLLLVLVPPYTFMLGRDMTASDDFHFKNWSYVFMKEFEAKNYDKLYVSIQPGVLTLYSNIIGFKSLYFLKDKLGLIPQTGKDFELLLNTFHKLPKVLTSLGIILFIYRKLSKITKPKFAFLVVVLLALEPLILGHARVIQTDALPMFIALLTLLILYDHRLKKPSMYAIVYIGVLSALCVLEKSLYLTLFIVLVAEITTNIFSSAKKWHHVQELVLYVCTFFITLVLLFPAFWGNFSFTLYRLTIGSFIFGVQGLDTEAFTYAKTQHLHDFFYYFRFLLNKVSAEIWVGLLLFTLNIKTLRKSFNKHQLTFLAFPLLSFSVLLIAEKKLGRYTILIFPYLILLASLGYYKLVEKRFIIIIVLFISVKLAQLGFLFPDFLMYKNLLSFDQGFNNTAEAWGSGGKKLGDYLTKTYGVNKVLYTADYRFLYLYYAGEVLSKDALTCASVYDFIITTSPAQTVCNKKLKVIDTYAAHKDLNFYILK